MKTTHQQHLGLILDEKLIFTKYLKEKMSKAYKGTGYSFSEKITEYNSKKFSINNL